MQSKIEAKSRLSGVDLCRGIAAYAVVLVHSGDATWGRISYFSQEIEYLFSFAVPFFLAASFYFMICKLNADFSLTYWKARCRRLLIPYMVWTVIYLIAKIIIFSALNQKEELNHLLQNPFLIIFYGKASLQLYYLPLLLVGTSLIIFANYFAKPKIGLKILASLSLLSLILYNLLLITGNTVYLNNSIAFKNLFNLVNYDPSKNEFVRFISIELAWLVRCLPYFFIAMTLRYLLLKTNFSLLRVKLVYAYLLLGLFIVADVYRNPILTGFREVFLGYSFLLYGIVLSNYFKPNSVIKNLALCSFGIYLIHQFGINIMEIFLKKTQPQLLEEVTFISQLAFSIPTFLMSWLAVFILMKNKRIAKYLFGV
ncbi:MAG: acyltransferase family protein [Nostoc sp. ChiSLP01]|nr:acyltransferase family protein [Nostoc sp. CmiSLP01]MDZ8287971.1 acyltransferase family protein [Nostoc sp. ChiSLP01]